jgi:MFS family permease
MNSSPPLWVGFGICLLSLCCCILLCWMDKSADEETGSLSNFEDDSLASLSSVLEMGSLFWLITAICVFLYGGYLPFNYIASAFLTENYFSNMPKIDAQNKAGVYMSIPFFISAFMVPINGIIIDLFGQRAYLSLFSSFLGFISFTMFFYLPPIYGLIMLGLTYSLFASVIWPAISLVVRKDLVGFAYGITTSLQNAGLSLFPIIVAAIYSHSKNYLPTIYFFVSLMMVSILISVALIVVNSHHDSKFELI